MASLKITHEYERYGRNGTEYKSDEYSPQEFARAAYFFEECYRYNEKVSLEKQPERVLDAVATFAEILRKKNLLNDEELLRILGVTSDFAQYKVENER